MLSYHGPLLVYFSGKISNASNSSEDTNSTSGGRKHQSAYGLTMAHGIVLTVCWCLLVDIAMFVVIMRHRIWTYIIHALLMLVVIAASLALTLVLVRSRHGFARFGELNTVRKAHFILGVITMIWPGLQIFTGCMCNILQIFGKSSPKAIQFFSYTHKISGYILVLLCKANVLIGWHEFKMAGFWTLIGWTIFTTILYLYRVFLLPEATSVSGFKANPQYELLIPPDESAIDLGKSITAYPHNAKELSKLNYVVFADYVWDLNRVTWLHPAGSKLIDLVNGREIDRFIYGMSTEESIKNLGGFEHSRCAMTAAGKPILRLKRSTPLFSGMPETGTYFILSAEQYTKDHYVIYLIEKISSISYVPQPSIGFIGQYFTLYAFGKTRLYTSVQSMTFENRRFVEELLRGMGFALPQKEFTVNYG